MLQIEFNVPKRLATVILAVVKEANSSLTSTEFQFKWREDTNYCENEQVDYHNAVEYCIEGRFQDWILQDWTLTKSYGGRPRAKVELNTSEMREFLESFQTV